MQNWQVYGNVYLPNSYKHSKCLDRRDVEGVLGSYRQELHEKKILGNAIIKFEFYCTSPVAHIVLFSSIIFELRICTIHLYSQYSVSNRLTSDEECLSREPEQTCAGAWRDMPCSGLNATVGSTAFPLSSLDST